MRTIVLALTLALFASEVLAAKNTKTLKARGRAKLGTSHTFDGTALHGRFQGSPGTTALVENDKFLDDLLGPRKNFKDRTAKDRKRN